MIVLVMVSEWNALFYRQILFNLGIICSLRIHSIYLKWYALLVKIVNCIKKGSNQGKRCVRLYNTIRLIYFTFVNRGRMTLWSDSAWRWIVDTSTWASTKCALDRIVSTYIYNNDLIIWIGIHIHFAHIFRKVILFCDFT